MEAARKHILRFIPEDLEHDAKKAFSDFKTVLQEVVQKNPVRRSSSFSSARRVPTTTSASLSR